MSATKFLTDKLAIQAWLHSYGVRAYSLVKNKKYGWVVDALTDVDLGSRRLKTIPVKFNIVDGYFDVSNNQLTCLDFSPIKVKNFFCDENRITSLEGVPRHIKGSFNCGENKLTSLDYGPKRVDGEYFCYDNKIKSLKGIPRKIGGLNCENNKLTSLEGGPTHVSRYYLCEHNPIKDLKGCPKIIPMEFYCGHTLITSLKNGPLFIGSDFSCTDAKLKDLSFLPFEIENDTIDISGNRGLGEEQKITSLKELKAYINRKEAIKEERSILSASIAVKSRDKKELKLKI